MNIREMDVTRTTLGVMFLFGLVASSLTILQPFLPSIIWAATLVIATWPVMVLIQKMLFKRRSLAVLAMTLGLLAIVVIPFGAAVETIVKHSDQIVNLANDITTMEVPTAPMWVEELPMVGDTIAEAWNRLAREDMAGLLAEAKPYIGRATTTFVSLAGSVGQMFVQLILTILMAAIMYANGEAAASAMLRFGHRLAGERGENSVRLAALAIRGVALGVVVTALVQTLLGGIGLLVTGVPLSGVLTAVILIICIIQLGPAPVMIPAVIWLFATNQTRMGVILTVFTVVVLLVDNILRPLLIRKGAPLPLLLILVGVIGGLLAFGLIGLFVGPAMLAVTYTLLMSWLNDDTPSGTTALADPTTGLLHAAPLKAVLSQAAVSVNTLSIGQVKPG